MLPVDSVYIKIWVRLKDIINKELQDIGNTVVS